MFLTNLAKSPRATEEERRLLSAVIAAAEREGRAVRLMIVPGVNVFDSVIETRCVSSRRRFNVGESETLSADDQARRLGDAWERASKASGVDVRLVVHHPRGQHGRISAGRACACSSSRGRPTHPQALARRGPGRWSRRASPTTWCARR